MAGPARGTRRRERLCKRKRKRAAGSCGRKGGVAEQEEKKTKKNDVRARKKAKGERYVMLALPWLYGHCVVSVLPCTLYGAQVFLGILCRIHIQPSRSFSPCFCARFADSVRTKRFHGIKF